MNRIVQYGSVEAIPYYNCSWKNFSEWEATGVKKPYFGFPLVFFGVFVEFLYIPIIFIIFTTKLIKLPCYKIIVFLAMIDMSANCCSCLITGSLLVLGSVFCMYPTFTYVAGSFTMSTWSMACAATVFLFTNRIVGISFRKYADVIEKKLAYTSIVIVLFYGIYVLYYVPTIVYNSDIMAWLPDPLSEEYPSEEAAAMYKNIPHELNNWVFVACMMVLFTLYFVMVKRLAKGQKSKSSKAIFIQCSIICFFNTAVAIVYSILAFMTPAPWILVFCQICWAVNHACPAFIYITLNDTIRREFYRLVFRKQLNIKMEDVTLSTITKKFSMQARRKSSVRVMAI